MTDKKNIGSEYLITLQMDSALDAVLVSLLTFLEINNINTEAFRENVVDLFSGLTGKVKHFTLKWDKVDMSKYKNSGEFLVPFNLEIDKLRAELSAEVIGWNLKSLEPAVCDIFCAYAKGLVYGLTRKAYIVIVRKYQDELAKSMEGDDDID